MSENNEPNNVENLHQYIKETYSVLNSPSAKNSQPTLESFKNFLNSSFASEEKTNNIINVITEFIFPNDNSRINKDPFILFPIFFSTNPKDSVKYINSILAIISKTISDQNRPLFSFISQIFGQIINSLFNNSSPNNSILLDKKDEVALYETLLNFCLEEIKQNKKNEQTCGCLYLTELIENCYLVKDNEYLKQLWDIISGYIDDKFFFAKLEMLNCIISLIFAAEVKFKPYATVALFKILDYLTDTDWMKRKLGLNVVYTLSFYCKEEIVPLKEHIIEFLNVLKNDKVAEVREVCLQTVKFLTEGDNIQLGNGDSSQKSDVGKNSSYKKKTVTTSIKKKNKSSSLPKKNINLGRSDPNFSKKRKVLAKPTPPMMTSNSQADGLLTTEEKINKIKKEKLILEQIEKEIIERRARTPLIDYGAPARRKSPNVKKVSLASKHYSTSSNNSAKKKIRARTPNHKIEEKPSESHSVKIKVVKSSLSNTPQTEDIEPIKEEEHTALQSVSPSMSNLHGDKKPEADQSSALLESLSAQMKKLMETQNTLMSSIASLTKVVSDNYVTLNTRITKLEKAMLDKSSSKSNLNGGLEKVDEEWNQIKELIQRKNYSDALDLSVVNDQYLFRTISLIPSSQVKTIKTGTVEDVLSRLIALIPRGEHLTEIMNFCESTILEKVKIKPITKQNLKDVIGYLYKNKKVFMVTEETNKKIDNLRILLCSNSISSL